MNFKTLFRKILNKKLHPAHKPHIPQPSSSNQPVNYCDSVFDQNGNYAEAEAEIQNIHGTSIAFGIQRSIQIDDQGRPKALTQNPAFVIGTGKVVSQMKQIGGACNFCQILAMQAYEDGDISLEQAQLKALFDVNSARQCDLCGVVTCSIHCRPTETPEGVLMICAGCHDEIKRKQRRKAIISFILSPILEYDDEDNEEDKEC